MFKNMKLGTKLIMAFLLVGIIPFAVIAFVSLNKSSSALETQAFGQLQGVREIKKAQIAQFFAERKGDMGVLVETVGTVRKDAFEKLEAVQAIKRNQIEGYFGERLSDISVLSGNNTVKISMVKFEEAFSAQGGNASGAAWNTVETNYGQWLKQYKEEYGYYDLFLIAANGNVVYTVAKESDLGKNLITGPLKDSPLGKLFKNAMNGIALQDFEPYAPSNGEPAGFVGAPVKFRGTTIGVVALQLSTGAINAIMQERHGLGKTGETYLVGPDKLMRSDSYLDPVNHSIKASFANPTKGSVDTEATQAALAGKSGMDVIIDYNGNPVLSVFAPIKIKGLNWAIIAEIDVAEAFNPVDENGKEFFAKYVKMYGYYDLFLMNPDGYVFYSVAKESDYQTNMVSGKFSSSGLGKLTREVLGTRQFGLADFSPYAPSNDEPAAFIAQPVVDKVDNEIEVVVALQLSLEAINNIMQQREGMGETGETYLVGSDKLMRSDSFLDPTGHSVKASFANPSQGSVNTEATSEALAGKTDQKIIIDYNGNPVLSAYTPLRVGNTTWALIAEIDEAEAFAAVKAIEWITAIVAIIGIAAILAVAILITRSISKPINRIVEALKDSSTQVSAASGQISSSSQSLAEGATEQASALEETSSSLEEIASMTRQNADNANNANSLMKDSKKMVDSGVSQMREMTEAMDSIKESSGEISKIIKVIEEIAFQTNLLALNAAVEAARAGEHGKGFAVVAEEVRNLAQRSATASKDTAVLIENAVKKATDGSEIVKKVAEALSAISESTKKVGDLVGEIAAASNEQATGVDQVNQAVGQMDQVTQTNAANAEESASASEELNAQSDQMDSVVDDLYGLVNGATDGGNGHARKAVAHSVVAHKTIEVHKGLPAPKKAKAAPPKKRAPKAVKEADEVIPFDDEDFKEF